MSIMNRILVGSLIVCCSSINPGCEKNSNNIEPSNAPKSEQNYASHVMTEAPKVERNYVVSTPTDESKNDNKSFGPFKIGENRIFVVSSIKRENDALIVKSIEIKDETGASYYKHTYKYDSIGNIDIQAFKLEGRSGEGLLLIYDEGPSAPGSGRSFQIFGTDNGMLKPITEPISFTGSMEQLPQGESKEVLRLFDGDIIKVDVWKDMFGVYVPLKVDLTKLTITPLQTPGVFDIFLGYEPRQLGTEPDTEAETIKLYDDHNTNSKTVTISTTKIIKIEFLKAYADVHLVKSMGGGLDIGVSNIWLKVKVNGRAVWVKIENDGDLYRLGLTVIG